MMSFSDAVKTCFVKKYATISGRASRSEFWWFQLFIWSVFILLCAIGSGFDKDAANFIAFVAGIFYVITLIPNFCSRVRRLHDTNHSGLNLLWCCIPYLGFLGAIYILILECMGSDEFDNKYGPNPQTTTLNTEPNYSEMISSSSKETHQEITDVDL